MVRPLLLDCLLHDPRWDRQVETRADYYAALIVHTALPLEPLDAHLRAAETVSHSLYDLALDTLCALAARGPARVERMVSCSHDDAGSRRRSTDGQLS